MERSTLHAGCYQAIRCACDDFRYAIRCLVSFVDFAPKIPLGSITVHLNYLPVRFTSDAFSRRNDHISGNPKDLAQKESALSLKLRELRQNHDSTHLFYASANTIACIPLTPNATLIGDERQFTTLADFQFGKCAGS
jgi:hypothetical protein